MNFAFISAADGKGLDELLRLAAEARAARRRRIGTGELNAILKQYKDILRDDVPVGVKVSIEQARKYPDLLKGIHVWTGIPVAGDLDGFAAEVEAAEQSW